MVTWAGAFVEASRRELEAWAPKHGLDVAPQVTTAEASDARWLFVEGRVSGAELRIPRCCQELSRDLHCAVIGFFLQSTASVEDIAHFDDGVLVRQLAYSGDEGGWTTQHGAPQEWEQVYFFPEGEGIEEGQDWPHNLTDEVSDDDLERYRAARRQNDASGIMDLLSAGSPHSILCLARHLNVELDRPAARLPAAKSWKPGLIVASIVIVLVGAFVAGLLTTPGR